MFFKLVVLLVCLVGTVLGEGWPVLVLGSNSVPRPVFSSISQDEFAEEFEPKANESMIVVFLEKGLRNAELSCSKPSTDESCFKKIKDLTPITYFANVQRPTEALQQISPDQEWVSVDENGDLNRAISCEKGKIVFVDLPTKDGPRNELFEMHDDLVSKVHNKFSAECKITAIYTRTEEVRKERRRRATATDTETATSGTKFHSGKDFLIYFTDLAVQELVENKIKTTPITMTNIELTGKNDTAFTVNLSGATNKMSFLIYLSGGYFQMADLMLDDEAYYVPTELNAPTNFSYYCGNQSFSPKKSDSHKTIIWNSLQMQAPFNPETPEHFKFGDPWYCVGFFSPGILAGLFVTLILLGIISVGICWMLDINTMDRFDDPKGKTITINVAE